MKGGTFRAEADLHSKFDDWSGDCAGAAADSDCALGSGALSAHFSATEFRLRLQHQGEGGFSADGSVLAGENWVARGAALTIHAQAAPNWVLAEWGGVCLGTDSNAPCVLSVNSALTVSATFVPAHSVIVRTTGSGFVEVGAQRCTGLCAFAAPDGETLTLRAVAGPRAVFLSWAGACPTDNSPTCTIVVHQPTVIDATFVPAVVVSVQGDGHVRASSSGYACDAPCILPLVELPMVVELQTSADDRLESISGCDAVAENRCSVAGAADLVAFVERVFVSAEAVDAYLLSDVLVSLAGSFEYVWFSRMGDMSYHGKSASSAGVSERRATLMRRVQSGVPDVVFDLAGSVRPRASTTFGDGEHVFALEYSSPLALGARTLGPDAQDAVIGWLQPNGQIRWLLELAGEADEGVLSVAVEPTTNAIYALISSKSTQFEVSGMVVGGGGAAGVHQSPRLFVARIEADGTLAWLIPGPFGTGQMTLMSDGPLVVGQLDGPANVGSCLPSTLNAGPNLPPFAFRLDRNGVCAGASVGVMESWPNSGNIAIVQSIGLGESFAGELPFVATVSGRLEWGAIIEADFWYVLGLVHGASGISSARVMDDWCEQSFYPQRIVTLGSGSTIVGGSTGCVPDAVVPSVHQGLVVARLSDAQVFERTVMSTEPTMTDSSLIEMAGSGGRETVVVYGVSSQAIRFGSTWLVPAAGRRNYFRLEVRP